MQLQQPLQQQQIVHVQLRQQHHLVIHATGERARFIEHIRHAVRHAGAEIPAGATEHCHHAACHVFTGVVAHALHDGARA